MLRFCSTVNKLNNYLSTLQPLCHFVPLVSGFHVHNFLFGYHITLFKRILTPMMSLSQSARDSLIARTCHMKPPSLLSCAHALWLCPRLAVPFFPASTCPRLFFEVFGQVSILPRSDSSYAPSLLTKISLFAQNTATRLLMMLLLHEFSLHPRTTLPSRVSQ